MTDLERRYRRLLVLYPAGYRLTREDEMVGTYLATAQRLRFLDVVDVVRGAARQRIRSNLATAGDARNTAATLALASAVALAAIWFLGVECLPVPRDLFRVVTADPTQTQLWGVHRFGPFMTLGAVVWPAWLTTGLLGLWGRARPATVASVVLTLAVVPVSAITGVDRPSLLVLVPQAGLGVVAVAWPVRPQWTARWFVVGSGLVGAAYGLARLRGGDWFGYHYGTSGALITVACCLLVCACVSALPGLLGGSSRPLLVVPILAVPAALMTLNDLTAWLLGNRFGAATQDWTSLAVSAGGILVVSVLAFVAALGYRRRIRSRP